MDRGLLSDQAVIDASRDFVCIRTATYEDAEEAEFHREVLFGGSSDLRNFGYCILSPDGKKQLRRAARGPNFVYSDASEMAEELRRISARYPKKKSAKNGERLLPRLKNVRLALNVASCDGLPLVVAVGERPDDIEMLSRKLGEVIWREPLIGRLTFTSTVDLAELDAIEAVTPGKGLLVIQPGTYGLAGKVVTKIDAEVAGRELEKALLAAADKVTRKAKSHRNHVRSGRRAGQTWESEVPVPERRRRR